MNELSRRSFLQFVGGSVALVALDPVVNASKALAAPGLLPFTPVRLPHSLPIYTVVSSFLASDLNGAGSVLPADSSPDLPTFTVIDDVVVPPEYERYVIVAWGDRVFPNRDDYVGYNHDYTAYIPIDGEDEGFLYVNHEYLSYPISGFAPETPGDLANRWATFRGVVGFDLPATKDRELLGEFLYNVGGSIVRIRKRGSGEYRAVRRDSANWRIHGLSGLGINKNRSDAYQGVTAWGATAHQAGDNDYLIGTGPAVKDVFEGVNADGLGNKIIGTIANCSGGTTPWGTVLSAEENFQGTKTFFVGVTEPVLPNGSQTSYTDETVGKEFGMVGEKYGWIVEIDPARPNWRARKHSALGRFRHENIALRVDKGAQLIAYMGDDRRGGHVWKYVSRGKVGNESANGNSRLFEEGTLYVAKFDATNGTGKWIPLVPTTLTDPNKPSDLGSVQKSKEGAIDRKGAVPLPKRNGIAGQTTGGGLFVIDTDNELTALADYQGRTLANFYPTQGAILCDAWLAANLVGGTPSARPEDVEVHPRTKEVFIAMTDGASGNPADFEGYADSRIFTVSKYTTAINDTQQSGGLYKIIEDSSDGAGETFRWQRFVQAGEVGTVDGVGFANVDNLAFDEKGNVWGVTDMSTSRHNGIRTGLAYAERTINHSAKGSGQSDTLVGVFGNNWLFYIPTRGSSAGTVIPFASGPMRCEMTGPTFVGDTLIISVQHPGEDSPIATDINPSVLRKVEMLNFDGSAVVTQDRTVPLGSRWPDTILGETHLVKDGDGNTVRAAIPRPCTIGIKRKRGRSVWNRAED